MSSKKPMWSNKEAQFVKLWQQRECLYNISSKDYHDRSKKESAWREISEELQIPTREVITRAASLRTQYGKLVHPKPGGSGTKELTSRQKWILKSMEFLKCHVLPRQAFSTLECVDDVGNEEQDCAEETDDPASSAPSPQESWNSPVTPTVNALQQHQPKRKRGHKKSNSTETEENLEREKVSLLRKVVTNAFSSKDSDDLFGKYVASKMRQITDPVEKMKAEQSITAILYAAQERSMSGTQPPTEPCDPTPQPVLQDFPQLTSHTLNIQVKEEDKEEKLFSERS
ncbi:uncharacterized protein LOC106515779 isoform X2 [Austrofundulus limnaeus]|uniref:Uncharacterized protein LOC106515779 isoform X2 n=1 Tax=Austrofundulus limnaeus TaxID=52670 RepID=A0A2I4B0H0_AUSLI|nr:PREDICTED: uncharacterized protein LOC106515779 isoform X2 [Austrofundulus limnaeus]